MKGGLGSGVLWAPSPVACCLLNYLVRTYIHTYVPCNPLALKIQGGGEQAPLTSSLFRATSHGAPDWPRQRDGSPAASLQRGPGGGLRGFQGGSPNGQSGYLRADPGSPARAGGHHAAARANESHAANPEVQSNATSGVGSEHFQVLESQVAPFTMHHPSLFIIIRSSFIIRTYVCTYVRTYVHYS